MYHINDKCTLYRSLNGMFNRTVEIKLIYFVGKKYRKKLNVKVDFGYMEEIW